MLKLDFNDRFPYPFIRRQLVKSLTFHEPKKSTHSLAPSRIENTYYYRKDFIEQECLFSVGRNKNVMSEADVRNLRKETNEE